MLLQIGILITTALAQNETLNFCWKKNYNRGIGRIPKKCEPGKELESIMCRTPCKPGYTGVAFVCWKDCPPGFEDDGLTCRQPKPLKIIGKQSYNRGLGSRRICGDGMEKQGGLCYELCKPTYKGLGPMCFKQCGGDLPFNCGASCTKDKSACKDGIISFHIRG